MLPVNNNLLLLQSDLVIIIRSGVIFLFYILYSVKKIFIKNFDIIFSGTPILARRRMVPPKMSAPGLPMTPLFNAESFSTLKVGMFAKKNTQYIKLRFD